MISLDALIAESKQRAKSPKRAPASKTKHPDYYRTKEELLQMKLDACVPMAVHLRTTTQKCECGAVFHSVNTWPLVKRVSPSLTHFEPIINDNPTALSRYDALPRVHENRTVDIPWCEDCFSNATYVEVPRD